MDITAAFAAFEKYGNKMTPKKNKTNQVAAQNINTDTASQISSKQAVSETNAENPPKTNMLNTDNNQRSSENTPPQAKTPESLAEDTKVSEKQPKQTFLPVDINIAGTPHRITCPADEIKTLEESVLQINNKIRNIRQDIKGKTLTNEELLVLTCLELYDEIRSLQDTNANLDAETDRAMVLIEKMIKDAKSAL